MTAPFGIELNQALNAEVISDVGNDKSLVVAPKPHPDFSSYVVQSSARFGVVWVKGVGHDVHDDSYGNALRTNYSRLQKQLQTRYGSGEHTDFIDQEGLWTGNREWLMAKLQGERFYHHLWGQDRKSNLPDDLATVFLGVNASDINTGNLILEYASSMLDAAEQELDIGLANLL